MREKLKLFTKVLLAELEDLEEDIATWGEYLEEKHRSEKITEYVFLQNNALLEQELGCVRTILKDLPPEPPATVKDLNTLRNWFTERIDEDICTHQFQPVIRNLMLRKIEKVYRYLHSEQ